MGLKQISSIVDRLWIHEAQKAYKILRNKALPVPEKLAEVEGHKHVKTAEIAEHVAKPKILFLGDGSAWEEKIKPFADLKQFEFDSPKEVIARIAKERCDLIIADADMGMKNIFAMAVELKLNSDLNDTPIFWLANSENKNIEQEKAILMESGAFDYIERDIEAESLESLVRWTLAQSVIGEGDELIILGKDMKSNYQLGLNLVKSELKVLQDYKLENPIDTLNQSEATWILINAKGMGESYKSILNSSLIWTKKKSHKCYVFLLAESLLQPEEEQRWARAGISDIFIYDTNIKSISKRIIERMKKVEDEAFEPSIGPGLPSPVIQRQLRKQMDERHEQATKEATSTQNGGV
jgi:DNA-binding response OmpR family regulator